MFNSHVGIWFLFSRVRYVPFCAGGLYALLRNAVTRGDIQGFSICKNEPKLTHLFFVDDCLILCRSTLEECSRIQELLAYYEVASRQMINKEKTTLFFSKNIDERTQEDIKLALNVPSIQHYEKYLDSLLLWAEIGRLALLKLKNGYGLGCRVGRRSSCLRPKRRS